MHFSEKIKFIRDTLKLNQKELAKHLETTQATISRYEKNERIPDINFLNTLISTFGINPMWIFEKSDIVFLNDNLLFYSHVAAVASQNNNREKDLENTLKEFIQEQAVISSVREKIEKLKGQTLLEKTIDYFTGKSPRMLRVFLEYLQYLNKQNINFSKNSIKNEFIDTLKNFEPSLKFELKYLLTTGEKDKKNLIEWAEKELDDASIYEIMSALPILVAEVEENMTSLDKFISKIVPMSISDNKAKQGGKNENL